MTEQTWITLPVGDTRSPIFMRIHEPDSYSVHGAESDTENEQLEWDPETIDDDGHSLVDEKNGPTLVPVPHDGPLDEAEASSLTAWA